VAEGESHHCLFLIADANITDHQQMNDICRTVSCYAVLNLQESSSLHTKTRASMQTHTHTHTNKQNSNVVAGFRDAGWGFVIKL
jgi:hypothetical protein